MMTLSDFPENWGEAYREAAIDEFGPQYVVCPIAQGHKMWGYVFGLLGQDAVTLAGRIYTTPRLKNDSERRKFVILAHESVHQMQQPTSKFKFWAVWVPRYLLNKEKYERPAYALQNRLDAYLDGQGVV